MLRYSNFSNTGSSLNYKADTRVDLVATNGVNLILDYVSGNAFSIDATGLTAGQGFTIQIANWPTGSVFAALSLQIKLGEITDIDITWPPGVPLQDLEAYKRNRFTISSWDNGITVDCDKLGPI